MARVVFIGNSINLTFYRTFVIVQEKRSTATVMHVCVEIDKCMNLRHVIGILAMKTLEPDEFVAMSEHEQQLALCTH